MKKIFSFLLLMFSLVQFAQAPQGFNYQATVRNSSGNLIINQNVYFKFNILQGSSTSLPVFSETHYVPTDELGQVNLVIGQGTSTIGNFSTLDWSLGSYYLGIELNTGSGYTAMGTTQLLSVPYALYAQNSGNSVSATPNLSQVLAVNNSANNTQIKDVLDPTENQDVATKNYVDNQIALNQIPNGNNVGDLLYWNGTSWQPISNTASNGGKVTVIISGDITNAEAAQKIAEQVGINTESIIVRNTTQLTSLSVSGASNLNIIEVENNPMLNTITFDDVLEVETIEILSNSLLNTISFPDLLKANGILDDYYELISIYIHDCNNIQFVNFPMLQSISGGIKVTYNQINNLSFSNLVKGNIYYQQPNAPTLSSLSLPNFQNGDLKISNTLLTSVSVPSLNNCSYLEISGGQLPSSQVNTILNKMLTVTPSSGKEIHLSSQTPPAPPTGQGLIDKQSLINNENNVVTD